MALLSIGLSADGALAACTASGYVAPVPSAVEGAATITCTGPNDTLTFTTSGGALAFNGSTDFDAGMGPQTLPAEAATTITVVAADGNVIGADAVAVVFGDGTSPASALKAEFIVNNMTAPVTDTASITVDDSVNGVANTISMSSLVLNTGQIASPSGINVTYTGQAYSTGIVIRTGTAGDTVNLQSARTGMLLLADPVTVQVTNGDTVNAGDSLDLLAGAPVTVTSAGPTDAVLNVRDNASFSLGSNIYTLAPSFVQRITGGPFGFFTLTYVNIGTLSLLGSQFDDTIAVIGTSAGVTTTVDGGAGNDTSTVSSGLGVFPVAPAFVDTLGASDVVIMDDSAFPTGTAYTFGGTTVSRPGFVGVTFGAGIDDVRLLTGIGENTIAPTATNARIGVIGNVNVDRFVMTNGLTLPAVTFDGGAGENVLDYSAVTAPVTVHLGNGTATGLAQVANVTTVFGGTAGDSLTGGAAVDKLNGGQGNDVITGGPGVDILSGGPGDDTFAWNEGDGDDTMAGDEGVDVFQVNGSDAAGDAIVVTANGPDVVVTRTMPSAFSVQVGLADGVERAAVLTLGGSDAVNIQSAPADLPVTIDTGADGDTITIDSNGDANGGIAKQVFGPLTVDGGAGSNTLSIVDTGTVANTNATISPTQIGAATGNSLFSGSGSLTYTNIAALNVAFGSGNDVVSVAANPNTAITLNGGPQPAADSIDILQNGATNPGMTGNGANGQYTASNRQPITFSQFEQLQVEGTTTAGVVEFASPTYTVNEKDGQATVTLKRSGGVFVPLTLTVQPSNGSATAPDDFSAAPQRVTFAPGETSATVQIPVVLDGQNEADETVKLDLSGPNDGTTLGAQKTATLTIANSAPQAACTPRPKVQTQVIAGGSRLQVRIEATPLNSQQNNAIQQLVFGSFHNARVTLNGQLVGENQTINLPAGLTTVELFVERAVAGEPTTVPFSVIDGCGEWKTFVGGGAGAGF